MKPLLFAILTLLSFTGFAQSGLTATRVVYLHEMNASQLIDEAKRYNKDSVSTYVFNYVEQAKEGWVKQEDIAMLVPLVRSEQRCKCLVSMFSSRMPERSEYSTLGGIAMDMIDAYRKNEEYPQKGTQCTMTDKQRADEIEKWWKAQRKK